VRVNLVNYIKLSRIFLVLVIFLHAATSFAKNFNKITPKNDFYLKESLKCMSNFRKIEKNYHIPKDLLHSISIKESGRYHKESGKVVPWPWAVNEAGKPYYFSSKSEAISFVTSRMEAGQKNIDVGCMQISMLYHKNAFKSLAHAFDPLVNIKYGAEILTNNYKITKDWNKAVARYHSANHERGTKYQESVAKIASNIDKHKLPKVRPLFVANSARSKYFANVKTVSKSSLKKRNPKFVLFVPRVKSIRN
jgi:soluble lytic murein transglycosylase-like protein